MTLSHDFLFTLGIPLSGLSIALLAKTLDQQFYIILINFICTFINYLNKFLIKNNKKNRIKIKVRILLFFIVNFFIKF